LAQLISPGNYLSSQHNLSVPIWDLVTQLDVAEDLTLMVTYRVPAWGHQWQKIDRERE